MDARPTIAGYAAIILTIGVTAMTCPRPCAAGEWAGEHVAERRLIHRVHTPDEYVQELADDIAAQAGLAPGRLDFTIPIMRAFLRGFEPAALEYTEWVRLQDGEEKMRTFFLITDYSDNLLFNLAEKVLRVVGVGGGYDPDMPIAFVLLGGVLIEFGSGAGLPEEDIQALLEFRLDNSDFLTVTSWLGDFVEVTNLETGRVDRLDIGWENNKKTIDHVRGVLWQKYRQHYRPMQEVEGAYERYLEYVAAYDEAMAAFEAGENPDPPLPEWKRKRLEQ